MRKSQIPQPLETNQPSPHPPILARDKLTTREERLYATTDANHNVTSVDDVFGAVKERFVYGAYRDSTVLSAAFATTSDTLAWSIRSQGEREDATTNTIDGRNRLYGIGMGRWMQADSAGYIDGANRYQSFVSNPMAHLDPSGNSIIGNCNEIGRYLRSNGIDDYEILREFEREEGWAKFSNDGEWKASDNLHNQILMDMLRSPRVFKVTNGTAENLEKHVQARMGVVRFAKDSKVELGSEHLNGTFWKGLNSSGHAVLLDHNTDAYDAYMDMFNSPGYKMYCYNFVLASLEGGLALSLGQQSFDNMWKTAVPTHHTDVGAADDDFVPGEACDIKNLRWNEKMPETYKGENLIVGSRGASPWMNGVFYGIWTGGRSDSLEGWYQQVGKMSLNEKRPDGKPSLQGWRERPAIGLDNNELPGD